MRCFLGAEDAICRVDAEGAASTKGSLDHPVARLAQIARGGGTRRAEGHPVRPDTAAPAMTTTAILRRATIEDVPLRSRLGLWGVALALGSVTAFGVWLFNQAIDAVGSIVSDVLVPALGPLGAWWIGAHPGAGGSARGGHRTLPATPKSWPPSATSSTGWPSTKGAWASATQR